VAEICCKRAPYLLTAIQMADGMVIFKSEPASIETRICISRIKLTLFQDAVRILPSGEEVTLKAMLFIP
jgi:hypothetical protein